MASTWIWTTPKASPASLPIPKVRLQNDDGAGNNNVQIDWYVYAGNSTGWQSYLFHFPEVVANDLTQEQIDKGVYVEMMIYRRGKNKRNNANEAGYIVPAPWIGGVNPLGNKWTRGGDSSIHSNMGGGLLAVDRPNHYQVISQNQVIPVWRYLNNRFTRLLVQYRDSAWLDQFLECSCPASRAKSVMYSPGGKFGYSAQYTPMYIAFRYVMWDEESRQFISWPTSQKIKIAQRKHPFNFNPSASAIIGRPCVDINPLSTPEELQCWLETRLP